MDLSLAFVKNESQVLYQTFGEEGHSKPQIMDIEDLESKPLHNILLPKSLLENAESSQVLKDKLERTNKYAPIKTIGDNGLTADSFDQLQREEATQITQSTYMTWSLRNNLHLVENIMAQVKHLKELWPNDRTAFFEELWHILRSNLGATQLTLAYNHLKKAEKEGEKNQLIRVVIEGQSKPNPSENKELGEALFKNYEGKFSRAFEVYSYNQESGEAVILAKINESPVIVMARVFEMTALQRATFNALFEGLQN